MTNYNDGKHRFRANLEESNEKAASLSLSSLYIRQAGDDATPRVGRGGRIHDPSRTARHNTAQESGRKMLGKDRAG